MKRSKRMLSMGLAALLLCAMPFAAGAESRVMTAREVDSTFVARSTDMSLDLLQQLHGESKGENIVFSPLSIQYILAILNSAADGNTHKAINKFWNYPSDTATDVLNGELQNIMAYYAEYYRGPDGSRFDIANAMFVKPGYRVNPSFQKVMTAYSAQIESLDFTKKGAVDTVNRWASEHTNGRIPKIIDSFSDPKMTRMVFLNAVNLEARWEHEFQAKNTRNRQFYGSSGTTSVPTMSGWLGNNSYYRDSSVEFARRSLLGQYSFFVILPRSEKKGALSQVIDGLSSEKMAKMLAGGDTDKVKYEGNIALPRFSVAYSPDDLTASLKAMGLDLKAKGANYNKATVKPQWDLILGQLVHKANIDVNEEGVTASAVTLGELATGAAMETRKIIQVEMKVNRPFVYGIADYDGNILFLGTVENLATADR